MNQQINYESFSEEDSTNKEKSNLSFREAMSELNRIIALLEGNTLELEESLEMYKKGVELLSYLKKSLNNAQLQIEELIGKIEADEISDQERDTNIS